MTMTTDITELAQSEINDALAQLKQISEYTTPSTQYARVLRKYIATLVEALEKAQTKAVEQGRTACELFDEVTAQRQRIAELEEAEQQLCAANVTLDARAELAERQLVDLESRTVTLKLLKDHVDDADLFGWGVVVVPLDALKEACADAGVTVEITNAGIKCEAE
ncbi:TPA: hypothetical protein ACGPDU_003331 [Raoultella ornithinolytica]|nr:hypothetical protein [Raoultella ornithinolytica]